MKDSAFEFSSHTFHEYEYTKGLGGYKPKFVGIPNDYYPLSTCETIMYSALVLGIIGGVLGIMIGFLFWVLAGGLSGYIMTWSIVFLVFTFLMLILFYFGAKGRIKEEKKLIE